MSQVSCHRYSFYRKTDPSFSLSEQNSSAWISSSLWVTSSRFILNWLHVAEQSDFLPWAAQNQVMTVLALGHQQCNDAARVFESHGLILGVLKWLHTPKEWERESPSHCDMIMWKLICVMAVYSISIPPSFVALSLPFNIFFVWPFTFLFTLVFPIEAC